MIPETVTGTTIYASNPNVYYEPFITADGRVGYRVQTNNAGDCREMFVYLNPSGNTDDGVPNIFIYIGEENDPAVDAPDSHIPLHELEDGPLQACGHNFYQLDGAVCHGCEAGEDRHCEINGEHNCPVDHPVDGKEVSA